MKTIADLFEIMAQAVEQNKRHYKTWFFDFSGHVNKIDIKYYFTGWEADNDNLAQKASFSMDEDGIQGAYWYIKTKL